MADVQALTWRIEATLGHTIVHGDLQVQQAPPYPIDIRLRNVA